MNLTPDFIAITGNAGTGKSFISNIVIKKYGYTHIDADKIGHEILKRDEIKKNICKLFGKSLILENGEIDRVQLSNIVFADYAQLRKLESIVHPSIIEESRQQIGLLLSKNKKVVFEAAILFESGWNKFFTPTLTVICHKEIQRKRLLDRGLTLAKISEIIKAQMPQEKKIELSDFIIDTTCGEISVQKQLETIF